MVCSSLPSVKGGIYEVVLVASNFVRPDRVQAGRFLLNICSDNGNQTAAQDFESFEWERTADRHRRAYCHRAFYSLSVHHYVQYVESVEETRKIATYVAPMVMSLTKTTKSFESDWSTPLTGSKVLGSRNMG